MNDRTKSERKELHTRIRDDAKKASQHRLRFKMPSGWEWSVSHRSMLLLWGFIRGFKYRRIERITREHNSPHIVLEHWQSYLPELTSEEIQAWLDDPTGAIPAPPPRIKKQYEPAAE